MAWKNHQRPKAKRCTGPCGRTLPFTPTHFQFTRRTYTRQDGTERIAYYANSRCKECRNREAREIRRIDAALEGRKPHRIPDHLLLAAVILVRQSKLSQRAAAKQLGIPHQSVHRALHSGKYRQTTNMSLLVEATEFFRWLDRELIDRESSQKALSAAITVDSSVLRRARRDGRISAALVDIICTHFNRPDLAHLFTQQGDTTP